MSLCFLDTAFVLALEFANDQKSQVAKEYWLQFRAASRSVITTSFVLDEVVTHMNARGHHVRAVRVGQRLIGGLDGGFIEVDRELLAAGWDYFVRHQDKRYSLTDYISFVVMEQRGLRHALTFDRHFVQAGFEILPGR